MNDFPHFLFSAFFILFHFFNIKNFIYFWPRCIFVAAHGFSSCSKQASHCGGFPCFRAWAAGPQASAVAAHRFWNAGSVVTGHRLSCPVAQGSNLCPCIGKRILNHWTALEVLCLLKKSERMLVIISKYESNACRL